MSNHKYLFDTVVQVPVQFLKINLWGFYFNSQIALFGYIFSCI
jgi:hypothetical protein